MTKKTQNLSHVHFGEKFQVFSTRNMNHEQITVHLSKIVFLPVLCNYPLVFSNALKDQKTIEKIEK